jgi:hypothetical protein
MAGAGAHAPVAAEPPAGGRSEAPARFLQAEVRKVGASGRATKATKGFSPGAVHRVDVWVGSAVAEAIALATPFPDDQLPDTAAEHHLTVALTEASLPHPLQQEITLPATGDSTRAQLELPVPADAKLVDARIVVALDNRILQTARLRGPVRSRFRTGDRIELVEEALVRRDLNDLSGRSQFDMAVVLDATTDGRPVATTLRNGVVENLMLDDGIHDTVVLMSERLTGLASDPDTKADLTSPATAELLCFLANHGAVLRDKLLEAQVADAAILDQRRLQLVSVHPDTFLPIEFIFDLPAPAVGAPICPNAAKALEAGECAGDCPGADEIPAKVVCPMGFWCFNRVVERHATTRERIDALGGRAEAGLECDPTEARGVLSPVSSSLLAFSKRVDAKEPKPSVGLEQVLDEVTSKHAATAGSWQEWIEIVERDAPSLLVLLSHTVEDDQLELPGLEIADGDRLLLSNLDTCHVRSSKAVCPPIVLLLGCETALTGGYEQFMTSFQEKGAGIVVGTLATVLGYQAAPVAGALVEAIRAAGEVPGVTFGDVLVATRRQLLAQGLPMSMVLTAYGDADWRLTQ